MRNAEKSLSELSASAVKDGPGGAGPYRNFVNVNGGSKAENFVSEITPRCLRDVYEMSPRRQGEGVG